MSGHRDKSVEAPVHSPVPLSSRPPEAKFVLTANAALCSGCLCCEMACSLFHEGECNPSLSRLHVFQDPLAGADNVIDVCKQCIAPSCLYACYVPGAFRIDETTGARVIDVAKCVGCGRCAKACPVNDRGTIIKLHAAKRVYVKCDLCIGRASGPACIDACPWGVLSLSTP